MKSQEPTEVFWQFLSSENATTLLVEDMARDKFVYRGSGLERWIQLHQRLRPERSTAELSLGRLANFGIPYINDA
jgi:hypothetical protein